MNKILIEGNNSTELKIMAINQYLKLKSTYNKNQFLAFILQRSDKLLWKKELKEDFLDNIGSYFSFVQKEIKNNWNLLNENFENIEIPVFLTFDSSQTLMVKLIEFFKEKGSFKDIAFSSEELAQKMLSNLYSLSTGNIPYSSFSKIIKNQVFNKTAFTEETYEDLNKLLEVYLSRTLKLGVFDYPSSLYIFNNYLLENNEYLLKLKEYKSILVNDYECQVPCINKFLKNFKNIYLFNNAQGAYGIYFPNSKKDGQFLEDFKKETYYSSNYFLEKLNKNLFLGQNFSLNNGNIKIKKNFQDNFELTDYLLKLLKKAQIKGFKNITILSPSRNPVLINNLEVFANNNNLSFMNLDKNEKFLDNPHVYALCSLSIIYFQYGKLYLNEDEFKQILILIFGFNPFKASNLTKKLKIDKSFLEKLLINFPENKNLIFFNQLFKNNFHNIYEFYLALSENSNFDIKTKEAIDKLLDSSKKFLNNINIFQNIRDKNLEFFLSIRKGLKESETLDEINKKIEFQGISIGTPSSFLKLSKEVHMTIFIDINNNLWNVNFINLLQNPFLLNGFFNNKFYDFENDVLLKREELYNLISKITFLTRENMVFLGKENNSDSLLKSCLFE